LDSDKSTEVLTEKEDGWLSPEAVEEFKLNDFVLNKEKPHWGWVSFNDFFHREILDTERPIDSPDDQTVVVSANDGMVYKIAKDVKESDQFWIKSEPYSLTDMLNGENVKRFVNGCVFQSFLSGADYHRFRAPISGEVKSISVIGGLMFSDAESSGFDDTAGTYSREYESSVNTRALVFIDSGDPILGWVCVIPVGITEISSITITVKKDQKVKKGDELGYFSYGGSTVVLVFQPGAINRFTVKDRPPCTKPEGDVIKVNAKIAIANIGYKPQ